MTYSPFARAAAVAAAALLLAGCTPASPTPSPSSSASTSASPTPPPPPPAPTPTSALPPHTTDDPCLRDSLSITYTPTDNSAGHAHGILTMTNTSATTCNIEGFPAVWFDHPEAESKLGAQATKDTSVAVVSFDLVPGASTTSNVTITEAGFVDGCVPIESEALLVIPPLPGEVSDWTQFVRHVGIDPTPACDNADLALITVTPMVPAA